MPLQNGQSQRLVIDELNECDPVSDSMPPRAILALKHHQRTLLHRCLAYENGPIPVHECFPSLRSDFEVGEAFRFRTAVLADHPGSGKSMTLLALILQRNSEEVEGATRASLVIVPHGAMDKWNQRIQDFCPTLRVREIRKANTKSALHATTTNLVSQLQSNSLDAVLLTSTVFNRVNRIIGKSICWRRVIYYDVQAMSLSNFQEPLASFHWFVCNTWPHILLAPQSNNVHTTSMTKADPIASHRAPHSGHHNTSTSPQKYHSLPSYMRHKLISSQPINRLALSVVKTNDAFVMRSMSLGGPWMNRVYIVQCTMPETINNLQDAGHRVLMEHVRAGDMEYVLRFVKQADTESGVLAALRSAASVSSQRIGPGHMDVMCSICHEEQVRYKAVSPCCAHVYCLKCITLWLTCAHTIKKSDGDQVGNNHYHQSLSDLTKRDCPICKQALSLDSLHVIVPEAEPADLHHYHDHHLNQNHTASRTSSSNSKERNLSIILRGRQRGSKTLILSDAEYLFTSTQSLLRFIKEEYVLLSGTYRDLTDIAAFSKGDVSVMLAHPKAILTNCENLSMVTDVILMHRMDDSTQQRVLERINRCGRTSDLAVWKFLYREEMMPG